VIRGVILAESVRVGDEFSGHGMQILRWSRYSVSGAAGYQPAVWTAIEFEAPEASSGPLADDLARVLASPGWYANWSSNTEVTVVYPGKVFRYPVGDRAGRAAAQQHGRACGVPEAQLDWTE
jgi:hypothetical protein